MGLSMFDIEGWPFFSENRNFWKLSADYFQINAVLRPFSFGV